MIVVMRDGATESQIKSITGKLKAMGFQVHRDDGENRTILGVIGDPHLVDKRELEVEEGVLEVLRVTEPYKLASRAFHSRDTVVRIKDVHIGGDEVVIMAGPCAVESEEQIRTIAALVKKAGAKVLRGGAFKPRTSPYSFQGL